MKLLTKEIESRLETRPYGSQDGKCFDAEVVVKFLYPTGAGTWLKRRARSRLTGIGCYSVIAISLNGSGVR